MSPLAIFGLQFVLSLVVMGLLAKWVLAPWLARQTQREALFWLTIPHAFRYIGMVFLVPGVGAQAGDLEATVEAAMNDSGGGFIVNASRGVLYAGRGDDYAESARNEALKIRGRINVMREAALARGTAGRSPGQ